MRCENNRKHSDEHIHTTHIRIHNHDIYGARNESSEIEISIGYVYNEWFKRDEHLFVFFFFYFGPSHGAQKTK